jgi:hypothetical protein
MLRSFKTWVPAFAGTTEVYSNVSFPRRRESSLFIANGALIDLADRCSEVKKDLTCDYHVKAEMPVRS